MPDVETRLTTVETRVDNIDHAVQGLTANIAAHCARLDKIEQSAPLAVLGRTFARIRASAKAAFLAVFPSPASFLPWLVLALFLFKQQGCAIPWPSPTPPVPPDPPAPIPTQGLRVLIINESADLGKYPAAQREIFTSGLVRSYLSSHCTKIGSTPEFRIYDKDTDMTNESQVWQEAMKRPRQALPWIVISDGKKGFEGPLPGTIEDTLTLLKKYGGV